jgi:hypothetical protein
MRIINVFCTMVLIFYYTATSEINKIDNRSYNAGIKISQNDINSTLSALCRANYLGYAAPGPVNDWITVNGFRVKVTSASIDLSSRNTNNVCDLNLNIDGKADGEWSNTLVNSVLGNFKVKVTLNNVKLKILIDIVPTPDGNGYNLVGIPVGWDAGSINITTTVFKLILGLAEYVYNGNANQISHMYDGHILNKPIILASVSKLYENLPERMMEYGAPLLSFENNSVIIGWKARKNNSMVAILYLLLND